MSVTRHFVLPKLPTALADDTHVDLPGYDIFLIYMDIVHVIPTQLDVSKFGDAFARVLQLYPHAAGQLRCADGRWSIELTNTPIPMDVEHRPDVNSDSLLDGNWVVQENLSPLLNRHPFGSNLVNGSAPLFRLKLTLLDHETCIGVSWNHTLGDATMMLRLIHTLSQFYRGLPPEFAAPSFKKYQFPAPSHSMLAELSSCMPLYAFQPFDEVAFARSQKNVEHVRRRMDSNELEDLRSTLSSCGENQKYLSKQDCLTAYVVGVLNRHRSSPMKTVRNVTNYRHIPASFITENVAGNVILFIPSGLPTDIPGIARAVRDTLIRSREPNCSYALESVKSKHMLDAANAGKSTPFSYLNDHELFVNSHAVIDWCSANFGFPDGTRFHTNLYFKNCLRCYRSNPVKGEDGVWRPRPSIEISMGVSAELKPKVMETFARGVRYMLNDQRVQS